MKPKNTICLWFDKEAHEAARFYAATLGWNAKKRSTFMPCGAIVWLTMSLKEFEEVVLKPESTAPRMQ